MQYMVEWMLAAVIKVYGIVEKEKQEWGKENIYHAFMIIYIVVNIYSRCWSSSSMLWFNPFYYYYIFMPAYTWYNITIYIPVSTPLYFTHTQPIIHHDNWSKWSIIIFFKLSNLIQRAYKSNLVIWYMNNIRGFNKVLPGFHV